MEPLIEQPKPARSQRPYRFADRFYLILSTQLSIGIGLLILATGLVHAQGNIKNLLFYEPDKSVHTVVEKQPEFPGGRRALNKYLQRTLQHPKAAKAANVSGKVYIQFIVRRDGRITDVDFLKRLGFGCDEEAMRLVEQMPNWIPGSQSGRPVDVRYYLPIAFGSPEESP
jgi:protein TonB